ncbi:MAG: SPOR domain-containing protein [Gammaproteobacteria bacterium]|nr:MAG: SPOR domain-containing protein [Gammaproteobacteria bacterium]
MKERIIGLITIAALIVVLSFIYLKGDGLAEIEQRIEARQSVTVEEALIQADLIYPWIIQLGAFQDLEDAKILAKQFERKGYSTYVSSKDFSGKQIFRVRIRPSFEDEEVDPIIKRLERGDYEFQVLGKGQQ